MDVFARKYWFFHHGMAFRLFLLMMGLAVLPVRAQTTISGRVVALDDGHRVADILDFRTEPMEHIRDDDDVESNLYRYVWETEPQDADEEGAPEADSSTGGRDEQPTPANAAPNEKLDHLAGATYAVFVDQSGTGEEIAQKLQAHGATVVRITAGDEFRAAALPRTVYGPEDWEDASLDDWLEQAESAS